MKKSSRPGDIYWTRVGSYPIPDKDTDHIVEVLAKTSLRSRNILFMEFCKETYTDTELVERLCRMSKEIAHRLDKQYKVKHFGLPLQELFLMELYAGPEELVKAAAKFELYIGQ